jgi:hypothetical protein
MSLTVRLDPELERRLEDVCERRGTTKSAVVVGLIRDLVARESEETSCQVAARLGVTGSDRSEPRDRAANAKRYVRRALRAKHRR